MPKKPDKPIGAQLKVLNILFDGEERTTRDIAAEFNDIARSTAYHALAMLQKHGYVSARWNVETDEQPVRRFKITAKGRMAFEAEAVPSTLTGATAFRSLAPLSLASAISWPDILNNLVAAAIFSIGLFALVTVCSVFLLPVLLRARVASLSRRYPEAAPALEEFIRAHCTLRSRIAGVLGDASLLVTIGRIAEVQAEIEVDEKTATRPAPPALTASLGLGASGDVRVFVSVDGREVPDESWPSTMAKELFLFLLAHPQGVLKKEAAQYLFPAVDREHENVVFHSNLYRLRRTLGRTISMEPVILTDGLYMLNPAVSFQLVCEEPERT